MGRKRTRKRKDERERDNYRARIPMTRQIPSIYAIYTKILEPMIV